MRMNLLAFVVLSLIVCCDIWIVDNMSERTEVQDCVSVSRNNCAPIPVPSDGSTLAIEYGHGSVEEQYRNCLPLC
jgi:hypothetical protein